MRTLTEVFTPGAPSLPEGLRTLVVSPERELEPGMTVRATFTFRNQGGAPATGARVRMNMPEGLVYLVGTGLLDGTKLDDEQGNCPLLARNGAHIGDVAPGEERRIEISYSVAGAIENGTAVEMQAAVAAFEIAPVGSNIVRLAVRSNPVLENAHSNVSIEARHAEPKPGGEATVTVRIHNAGESSAHDVVVVSPIPAHTTYVPNSARVNGREIEGELKTSFDRVYAPVVVRSIPASATATLTYRVRIEEPLDDGTQIVARATVASQETPALDLNEASITVAASPHFDDEKTEFTVEPASEVQAGQRVTFRLQATNAGSMAANNVSAAFTFPEGLIVVRGAARLDGRPLRDKKKDAGTFEIGRITAASTVDLLVDAVVASPVANGTTLETHAVLSWENGERAFARALTVRSAPHLAARRNGIVPSGDVVVRPGDEVEAVITLTNDGSAALSDAVLEFRADPALTGLHVLEKNSKIALEDYSAEIDRLEPYSSRRFVVRGHVQSPYPDRTEFAIAASLHSRELGETQLGEAKFRVDSHPAFTAERSSLGLISDDVFRPNQLADVYVRLVNEGTDTANDVRLRLYISPEARLESVDGATRDRSSLLFGEIAPGASVEARLGLRLLRSLAREFPVTLDAVLTANSVLPTPLHRLTIVTTAEPDFSVGVLRCEPADAAEVGETIEYVLHVRNGGDGPARRVNISVDTTGSLIYVPNSTTVNDVSVRDVGAAAAFASERGIALNDVDPGVEATLRWREVVHNGLPAGESIVRVAHIRYDGERHDEIVSPELKVRSAPSFANNITGLPFGLDGMVGPSLAAAQRAISGSEYLELPPATPVARADSYELDNSPQHYLPLEALETSAEPVVDEHPNGAASAHRTRGVITTSCTFSREQLEKTLRFLNEASFGGLIAHLFAVRAFMPSGDAFETEREQLREGLDHLFIKLRLPNYVAAPRDIETAPMRTALLGTLERLERMSGPHSVSGGDGVHLSGSVDAALLPQLRERVEGSALGTAAPWYALATLMVYSTPHLQTYRAKLIEHLDGLLDLNAAEFIDALQRSAVPELDAALNNVKQSLLAPAG